MTLADPQAAMIWPVEAMPAMRIDLDMPVSCVDGAVGEVTDVVIDSGTRHLTHLVVPPDDGRVDARLLPTAGARARDGREGIWLSCTVADVSRADSVQESMYLRLGELPGEDADWGIGIQEMYPLPQYGSLGPEVLGAVTAMEYDQHVGVSDTGSRRETARSGGRARSPRPTAVTLGTSSASSSTMTSRSPSSFSSAVISGASG
jgi:hypothetical protein